MLYQTRIQKERFQVRRRPAMMHANVCHVLAYQWDTSVLSDASPALPSTESAGPARGLRAGKGEVHHRQQDDAGSAKELRGHAPAAARG